MTHAIDITREANRLISTSVDDATSSLRFYSVAVLELAAKKEMQRQTPRMTLVSRLKAEVRKRQRVAAGAPKAVA